jgi:hypothetical protein
MNRVPSPFALVVQVFGELILVIETQSMAADNSFFCTSDNPLILASKKEQGIEK